MQVRIYFNDAAGGSFAPGSPNGAASAERHDWRSAGWMAYLPMMDGFDPDKAVLVESMLSPMNVDADSEMEAAEITFAKLNADDRANGQHERSLSVGDMLRIGDNFYEVDHFGWLTRPAAELAEFTRIS